MEERASFLAFCLRWWWWSAGRKSTCLLSRSTRTITITCTKYPFSFLSKGRPGFWAYFSWSTIGRVGCVHGIVLYVYVRIIG